MLRRFYEYGVLAYPKTVLLLLIIAIGFLGQQAIRLEVDASAETLVLEDDEDLRYTRAVSARYGNADFLVVSFTPNKDLLSDHTLKVIADLKRDLTALEGVDSVVSILDVPLLESPPLPVKEMVKNVRTIESPDVDRAMARKEFINSPIYRNLIVSPDFKTTAIQVKLPEDKPYTDLRNRRNSLKDKLKLGTITDAEYSELEQVLVDFKAYRDKTRIKQHENIVQVRKVLDAYRHEGDLFLGGVSMIADDLITYVKNDLRIFGLGVLGFLVLTLWVIFRQKRWVLIPILCCTFSVIATCGILGFFGWEVTVISSNFVAIQLIITMAITLHLTVRYRELLGQDPDLDHFELLLQTVLFMAKPCLFAVLTTVAGFSSLILCDILPVINFGWMMSAGITVSLLLTFLIFPATLILFEKRLPNTTFETHFTLTRFLAAFTERFRWFIVLSSLIVIGLSVAGAMRLRVENSFIDYFKESTEIYQGMKVIDQQLGGTTPLDITVRFDDDEEPVEPAPSSEEAEWDDEFDDFEEEFEATKGEAQYWFTAHRMEQVEKIHDYLDALPETGKVLSLGTMLKVGEKINNGEPLDNFKLALVYNELPEKFKKIILTPYVSVEDSEVRFFVRVRDSEPTLRRNELIKKIRADLTGFLGQTEENSRVTGLLVLYNNMLQSLFDSQILTLGAVMGVLLVMFMIVFRSVKIAMIAFLPNILPVIFILGFMGWIGIPLDMMTITIAAISVGIAVDDTIHYIHRFMSEFKKDGNYLNTMNRCHRSIGYAMYYTTVVIVIGFSILVLSNFIPTIYFGLLTGLAMAIALLADLTFLPALFIMLKPLGPGGLEDDDKVDWQDRIG
ncbi:MAG: RND family transporter [Proteobacteria bacterium]|nr:RND family transporter [Pseudomonadota bacterium]